MYVSLPNIVVAGNTGTPPGGASEQQAGDAPEKPAPVEWSWYQVKTWQHAPYGLITRKVSDGLNAEGNPSHAKALILVALFYPAGTTYRHFKKSTGKDQFKLLTPEEKYQYVACEGITQTLWFVGWPYVFCKVAQFVKKRLTNKHKVKKISTNKEISEDDCSM
jgi:hypothetical protein